MIQTISQGQFSDEFHKCGRGEQFSYEGLKALYNYLVDLEEGCDMSIELDVIALCCEYTEYEDLEELQNDYDVESIEELKDNTTVIMINDDSFIIQCY